MSVLLFNKCTSYFHYISLFYRRYLILETMLFHLQGYLEWEEFSDDKHGKEDESVMVTTTPSIHQPAQISVDIANKADVLIAADVIYDRTFVPALVASVGRLLSDDSPSKAIFGSTFRNEKSFAFFEHELRKEGIEFSYAPRDELEAIPYIFPCYFDQPRSDVRICVMTKNKNE